MITSSFLAPSEDVVEKKIVARMKDLPIQKASWVSKSPIPKERLAYAQ